MSDELVCARCAGRVRDGGCPTCRAARADLQRSAPRPPAELFLVVSALAALLLLVLLAS